MQLIYKILPENIWNKVIQQGYLTGSPVDLADGYIHFSTLEQVHETALRHFKNQPNLLIIAINPDILGATLKWEASRDGALFPHLYAPLDLKQVHFVKALPLDDHNNHIFPELV